MTRGPEDEVDRVGHGSEPDAEAGTTDGPGRYRPRVGREPSNPVWRVVREPAVLLVLMVAVVHVVRRDVMDIVVFLGTVVLITVDGVRPRRPSREAPRMVPSSRGVLALICVAYGVAVLPLSRSGWPMRLLVVSTGLAALTVVLRAGRSPLLDDPLPERPQGHGWLWWPFLAAAAGVFELANFATQSDPRVGNPLHPTLSAIGAPLLADAVPRALFAALWLAVGFWLVRIITTVPQATAPQEGEL
ncbi:MAG TPA: hypothetical protein VF049_05670 [Nocardioidaceae bacterium]